MNAINWTVVSALVLAVWGIRYAVLAWKREVYPNPVSFFVWAVVGVALFLTAEASEAKEVYYAALVSAVAPVIIFVIVLLRETNRVYTLTRREKACLVFAIVGYVLWFALKDQPELAQWSLYWMIGVDVLALWPTLEQAFKKPMSDKPGAWLVFGLGYGVTGFAISDHTVVNWALPGYMFIGSWSVAAPLVWRRINEKIPLNEWY
ncbi:MAG: hypothetical protein H6780_00215 [Candidatus Nomurabacteria bacterium]|nr:MAG: hypothetical protein H6780_00215 [Candidatus Nomurabacteria bacterium]